MNYVLVYSDEESDGYNCSNWRIFMLADALVSNPKNKVIVMHRNDFVAEDEKINEHLDQCDIIIYERNLYGNFLVKLTRYRLLGKTIIVTFDDAYHHVDPSNPAYLHWHESILHVKDSEGREFNALLFPHMMDQFKLGLKIAHALVLPNKHLMEDWKEYSAVYSLPNYPVTRKYLGFEKQERDYLSIGWGGSISHFNSFKESNVIEAMKVICNKYDNVRFHIVGDKRVYDLIDLPERQKIFSFSVPYGKWAKLLTEEFDIGIAPLAGKYDEYRSWIKPLEYMLCKIPWVASDNNGVYSEIAQYGKIVNNSVEDWVEKLSYVIDNYEQEYQTAQTVNFEFALSQDIFKKREEIERMFFEIARDIAKIPYLENKTMEEYHDELDRLQGQQQED